MRSATFTHTQAYGIRPGMLIRVGGELHQIISVDSSTSMTLRKASSWQRILNSRAPNWMRRRARALRLWLALRGARS